MYTLFPTTFIRSELIVLAGSCVCVVSVMAPLATPSVRETNTVRHFFVLIAHEQHSFRMLTLLVSSPHLIPTLPVIPSR